MCFGVIKKYGQPIFIGASLSFAFSPISLPGMGIISLAWFFHQLINTEKSKKSFQLGWLYGFGFFALGTSWIFVSIHTYGHADIFSSLLVTILFCLFMGLYIALFALSFYYYSIIVLPSFRPWIGRNPETGTLSIHSTGSSPIPGEDDEGREHLWLKSLGFSVLWVIFEYLRAHLFTGFPWLLLGFCQNATPMKHLAPIIGVYGLSFLTAFSGTLLAIAYSRANEKKTALQKWGGPILGLLFLYLIPQVLDLYHWTTPVKSKVSVSIVQGNIAENEKWLPHAYEKTVMQYVSLTQHLTNKSSEKSRIIVWPEGAIPVPYQQAKPFLNHLSDFISKHKATLVTGIPYENPDNEQQYYNAMLLLGRDFGHYFKHHIVPFGEYLPAEIFRDIMRWLGVSLYETGRGAFSQPLLNIAHIPTLPFICYEIAYADILLKSLPEAQLFITISDDAWFGHSMARAQHLQIAQMRSLQTGRYQIVATNNGISAIINAEGDIVKTVPSFETRILNSEIQAMSGSTPWSKIGDNAIVAGLALFLMISTAFYALFRLKFRSRVCQHSG